MVNVILQMLDGFSLVWVLVYRHAKSAFLQNDYKLLNWSKWILVVDIPTQTLINHMTFIALPIIQGFLIHRKIVSPWYGTISE